MRWLLRALGALVLLVLLAVGLLALIPAEAVATRAAAEFQRLTGRALVIEGKVSPRFWPVLGVTTGPVTIANADWSDEGPMLRAESLSIEINAASLLGGEIEILGLRATQPRILLERASDGRENWVFGGGGSGGEVSTQTPGVGQAYTLQEGLIEGGALVFLDHGAGTRVALDAVEARLSIPEFTGPATLEASAVLSGQPLSLRAEAGVFSAFTEGRVVPLALSAQVGGSTLAFDGRAGWSPLAAEGALQADLGDLAALAGLAGAAAPQLPQGLGAESLSLGGQLTLDASGTAFLRGATIRADGNEITGDLDLAPGEPRPKLTATLRAGALALPGLAGGQGGGAGGGMQAEGWPRDRIDVSALGALDAEVALVAGSVDLGLLRLGETRLLMGLDRARAVFDIRQLAAYGGTITGQFVVNGRGGLSVGGDLTLKGIDMQALMLDVSGWDRLISRGNLTLKFLGVGNSVEEIMQGLKGEGSLSLGQGELKGLDIGGMLRTLDPGYVGEGQKTIFDGVAASFTMAGGVLSNSDLKLTAPYLTATGAGEIGLGSRSLNYRLRPTALSQDDGTGGIMVPLWITGPWADPTFRLDLESLAREKMEAEARAAEERLKAEAAAAEARAKAELEAKLQEELGVTAQEGESLEEAVKRRAEEALSEEAGNLLDGILNGN